MVETSSPQPPLPPVRVLLERAVHDLKNPLAVVRATLEWLDAELGARSGDVGEAVRDASDASARLGIIIEHLHALARLAEPGALATETVSVREIVDAAVRTVGTRPSSRTRRFDVGVASDTRVHVRDREVVVEAIAAVLEAAARHAPTDAALAVTSSGPDAMGRVSVAVGTAEDAGPAQPGATLPGSGLGLLFARAACEAHGGSLDVSGSGPTRAVRVVATFGIPDAS